MPSTKAYKAALQWHLDNGVDEALDIEPGKRASVTVPAPQQNSEQPATITPIETKKASALATGAPVMLLGASDARAESEKLAAAANTLEELQEAIRAFDGIALKKTATNLVFSDGNPKAP